MPSSKSKSRPCAACNYFHDKCSTECVFAPHFPPDQTHKIETLQKVYGRANVGKILSGLPVADRGAAVNSLVYEAEARLKDPVKGVVGSIAILENRLKQVQKEINTAKRELATYMGPGVLKPWFMQQPGDSADAHQQEMLRNLNQQQPMDLLRFNRCFDGAGPSRQHNQGSYETQQSMQAAREQDINNNFDGGAGASDQASYSGFTSLTASGETSTSLPFSGSYGSNVCMMQQQQPQEEVFSNLQNQQSDLRQRYPEQEQNHKLQYLLPHQLLLQQQNQTLQPQQHPQQEQHDHLQQFIEHQPMLQNEDQQSQGWQHPQQEKHQHLQSLLLPHQLLFQDQNQSLQPQSHPQEEHLDHLQQIIPTQILLQQQK